MAMSKDRIHFLLKDNQSNLTPTANAAAQAFGISVATARSALRNGCHNPTKIICRPSQFARFLVYRSKEVTNNTFSQFEAELVSGDVPKVMDVTTNQADCC